MNKNKNPPPICCGKKTVWTTPIWNVAYWYCKECKKEVVELPPPTSPTPQPRKYEYDADDYTDALSYTWNGMPNKKIVKYGTSISIEYKDNHPLYDLCRKWGEHIKKEQKRLIKECLFK